MSQQKQYLRWTTQENQRLKFAVNVFKNNNKQANWEEIQVQFPNHTIQQLKSQYSNIKNAKPTLYHTWSEVDETILYLCVINYGQDWKTISQAYFPNVSESSLKSKYHKYCKQRVFIHEVFRMLNTDDPAVTTVSDQILQDAQRHLEIFDNRVKLLLGLPLDPPDDYDRRMGVDKLDLIEHNNAVILSKQYDILKLQKNMYAELNRRNLKKVQKGTQ
ncbi:Myb-like_DNA-binding domain-containing protein [Hexamita inflata]|uniref:Myb-like_DNA-binding domain-containing protein n=1 Tax=Hexamita inflata TaxID=28002 RepID=A0ABP1HBY8_9EUKA